jgi:cobaltochelatase CobT
MYTQTLKQAMPIVATALGRRFGVQVQVGGAQAATDGHTIWLPDLPAASELRPVAWGLLAHEASHVRHTDMAVFEAVQAQSPLRRTLLNILEDIRIERAIRQDYPGTETTLARVIDWMQATGQLQPPATEDHPARILTATLLLRLRHQVLGQTALAAAAREAEQVLRQTFSASLVHRLWGLLTEVRRLGSTAEAAALAERLEQWLNAEATSPDTTPSPAPECGAEGEAEANGAASAETPDEDGSPRDGAGADDAHPPTASSQTAEVEEGGQAPRPATTDETGGAQAPDGGGDADPHAAPQAAAGTDGPESNVPNPEPEVGAAPEAATPVAGSAGGPDPSGTPNGALQQALAAGEGDLTGDLFAQARQALAEAAGADDPETLRLPVGEEAFSDPHLNHLACQRVAATSRALATRLQGLVQASRMDRPGATWQGRTLLSRRLHRVGLGETRLFARPHRRPAPNTALHLLVDLSGSMSRRTEAGRPSFQVALEAALAVALALEPIPGVSVAVTAFPGEQGEDTRVSRLIRHGQSVRRRADAFDQAPRGGTPLAQALWYAAADLSLRPEPRRLILAMTDGDPNDRAAAHEILALCRDQGLETIGVGIAYDVSWLFPVSLRIQDAGDLQQALFGVAERLLISG